MKTSKLIGRREMALLLEIGTKPLPCKIDTGAFTSSLHCDKIEKINDKIICTFYFFDEQKSVIFAPLRKSMIKSSTGHAEERYIIKTKIRLGKDIFDIELSLANRSKMKYPILLGRKFLNKKFLVDVSKKKLLTL